MAQTDGLDAFPFHPFPGARDMEFRLRCGLQFLIRLG